MEEKTIINNIGLENYTFVSMTNDSDLRELINKTPKQSTSKLFDMDGSTPKNDDGDESHSAYASDKDTFVGTTFTPQQTQLFDVKSAGTTSPPNSSFMRTHRTKLSTEDIKLILYLINRIKPFKYIGENNYSQNKKWEIIQREFATVKKQNNRMVDMAVPTVRTLQRQLATAIKKASARRDHRRNNGIIDEKNDNLFTTLNLESPIEELELALLELNDALEKLKNGKISPNISYRNGGNGQDFQFHNSPIISDYRYSLEESDLTSSINLSSIVNTSSSTKQFIEKLNNLKLEINQEIPDEHYLKTLSTIETLEKLLNQSIDYQSAVSLENFNLIESSEQLIKKQQEYIKKLLQYNKDLQSKQNQVNKDLINNIVDQLIKLESDYKKLTNIEKSLKNLKDNL